MCRFYRLRNFHQSKKSHNSRFSSGWMTASAPLGGDAVGYPLHGEGHVCPLYLLAEHVDAEEAHETLLILLVS